MRFHASTALAVVSMLVAGPAAEAGEGETIEYTAVAGSLDEWCPKGGFVFAFANIMAGVVDELTPAAIPATIDHCVPIPEGATAVSVRVADDVSDVVMITVAQLDEDGKGTWERFCSSGTMPLDPAHTIVSVHLLPYGQTSGACVEAGPPTQGEIAVSWG